MNATLEHVGNIGVDFLLGRAWREFDCLALRPACAGGVCAADDLTSHGMPWHTAAARWPLDAPPSNASFPRPITLPDPRSQMAKSCEQRYFLCRKGSKMCSEAEAALPPMDRTLRMMLFLGCAERLCAPPEEPTRRPAGAEAARLRQQRLGGSGGNQSVRLLDVASARDANGGLGGGGPGGGDGPDAATQPPSNSSECGGTMLRLWLHLHDEATRASRARGRASDPAAAVRDEGGDGGRRAASLGVAALRARAAALPGAPLPPRTVDGHRGRVAEHERVASSRGGASPGAALRQDPMCDLAWQASGGGERQFSFRSGRRLADVERQQRAQRHFESATSAQPSAAAGCLPPCTASGDGGDGSDGGDGGGGGKDRPVEDAEASLAEAAAQAAFAGVSATPAAASRSHDDDESASLGALAVLSRTRMDPRTARAREDAGMSTSVMTLLPERTQHELKAASKRKARAAQRARAERALPRGWSQPANATGEASGSGAVEAAHAAMQGRPPLGRLAVLAEASGGAPRPALHPLDSARFPPDDGVTGAVR